MEKFIDDITDIFCKNNWTTPSNKESMSQLISLGVTLSNDERQMLTTLIDKFLLVPMIEYQSYFKKAFLKINKIRFNGVKEIYPFPLLSPSDIAKDKSGKYILQFFKDFDYRFELGINKYNCKFTENFDKLPVGDSSKLILLVDDFIGTGDTAIKCIEELEKRKMCKNDYIVISIASMREGYDKIISKGVSIYTEIIQEKGIEKITSKYIRNDYYSLMNKLENRFSIPSKYRLGYGKSESLIKLIRPPNNTFPLFWHKNIPNISFPRF